MGIKKIQSSGGSIDITHRCDVQHFQGNPYAVIFDENEFHKNIYESMVGNPDLQTQFSPAIINSVNGLVFVAMIKLRTKDEFLEYVIQPSIQFIDLFRNTKSVVFLIESINYGFTAYDLYTKDFDEMYDKYLELKREENQTN